MFLVLFILKTGGMIKILTQEEQKEIVKKKKWGQSLWLEYISNH